jgi:diguanylate cyclase (GGDEF)-like protein/PAS domain S-box-containing protein
MTLRPQRTPTDGQLRRDVELPHRLLFENNPSPMWVYDTGTLAFLAVNDAAVAHYGYTRAEFLDMTLLDIRPTEDADRFVEHLKLPLVSGLTWRHRKRDGGLIDVEVTASDLVIDGRPARFVLAFDVTERRRAEAAAGESERRYRDLFENASAPIATVDLDETITEVNAAFARILGYRRHELVGTKIDDYLPASEHGVAARELRRKLSGDAAVTTYEQEFQARDGSRVVLEVSTRLIEEQGRPVGTQGICRDMTAQKAAEADLRRLADLNRHQALHDALTGLPNRTYFREAVENALANAQGGGGELAVLVMDLDRFKEINDTLGHHYGDRLLAEVAESLRAAVRQGDVVARLGGDEFGILLQAPAEIAMVAVLTAGRIERALERPFTVEGLPLSVDASIGIALHPQDGNGVELLLQRADVAMYLAKGRGEPHALYAPDHDRHDMRRLQLLGELRRALDQGELVVHYQPTARIASGKIERVEALLRWQHPTLGFIPPSDFVPLAEQTGLIRQLTAYVVEEALRQCRSWREDGLEIEVAVNLSARNLSDSGFASTISALLRRYEVPPRALLFEVTESAIVSDPARAEVVLAELRALGIGLAIDDFGTGYTSLAFLARQPLDQVKIDRSFVTNLVDDAEHAAVVRSIINLGHDLGLEVVAEGVETVEVWARLAQLGCDIAQGFYLTPPLPADQLRDWIDDRRAVLGAAA